MIPAIDRYDLIVAAYWLIMFVIATFILVYVTVYCTGESPGSFWRAAKTTLLVGAAVFFTYDFSGYLFAVMMQVPAAGVRLPEHYSYWDWLREPLALKWQVLSFVPLIRYLPLLFALIIGGIVQVFLWKIPFQLGLLVFIAQIVLNLLAMMALSFVFSLGISLYERGAEHLANRQEERGVESPLGPAAEPRNLRQVRDRVAAAGPDDTSLWRRIDRWWESFNSSLKPTYNFLQPVTDHFPLPVQDFLNGGGWLLTIPGLAGLLVFMRRSHRKDQHHGRRHAPHHRESGRPPIRLDLIGDALSGLGQQQVTVVGEAGRLRLVVMSPTSPQAIPLAPSSRTSVLESIRPGLAAVAENDTPKIECWNDAPARHEFAAVLQSAIQFPERSGAPSPWRVLIGDVNTPDGPVHVGLAILTKKVSEQRMTKVAPGQWTQLLGLRDVPHEDQGW